MRSVLIRLHEKSDVVSHECDQSLLVGLPAWKGSKMATLRCHFATLMPDVDWCLYLDCDLLYLTSVEGHFALRDDSVYACCVREESENARRAECTWINANTNCKVSADDYFNSGVVLFNLKKMREDAMPAKLMAFLGRYQDVPIPDQDALNACMARHVKLIDPKFNRLQIFMTHEKFLGAGGAMDLSVSLDCLDGIDVVMHYVCGNPWTPQYACVANGRFRLWQVVSQMFYTADAFCETAIVLPTEASTCRFIVFVDIAGHRQNPEWEIMALDASRE